MSPGVKGSAEFADTTIQGAVRSDLESTTADECAGFWEEKKCVNRICEYKNAVRDRCQTRSTIVADWRQTAF
jgi:hypothetical protein